MIEKLAALIATETGQDAVADTRLEDLGLDSLEFVAIMQEVGEKFWEIPVARWAEINTVADIARELVAAKQ